MKVLVASASKHGGTAEIAARIADVLRARGHDVRLEDAVDVRGIDGVDAVVLGSAVYYGRWLPEASKLVARCEAALRSTPVWLFSSGPTGDPPRPAPAEGAAIRALVVRTGARAHQVFGGRLDRLRLSRAERVLVKAVRSSMGDFRDWSEIERWSGAIADELLGIRPTPDQR